MTDETQQAYWISWYCPMSQMGKFELHSPWWISGETEDAYTVCAAIMASSEEDAKEQIRTCHDCPPNTIRWRFAEAKGAQWNPFSDRFPRAKWMKWEAK